MPHVIPLPMEEAPPVVRAAYEEFYREMQFPAAPNFIQTQGHSPTAARGTWELVRNVLVNGLIPRRTKEMIFVAISRDRNCLYCAAAHIACCRMLGVDPALLNQVVYDNLIRDPKLREMILFALKCSRAPQSFVENDFKRVREQGLGTSEIVELIAMSGLAVCASITADATAMEQDEMFNEL